MQGSVQWAVGQCMQPARTAGSEVNYEFAKIFLKQMNAVLGVTCVVKCLM